RGRKILLTVRRAAFAQAEFGIEGFSREFGNDVLPSSNMRLVVLGLGQGRDEAATAEGARASGYLPAL
ncbi:MAG: hypothetical protein ABUS57_15675, partial [Pseudomonadota bacterium]